MTELPTASGPKEGAGVAVDVCLLLEGTYPFVSGGVSSWTHQLVGQLSELRFAIVFLGGRPESYGAPRYELPPNVVTLEIGHLLTSDSEPPPPGLCPGRARPAADIVALHDHWRAEGHAAPLQRPDADGASPTSPPEPALLERVARDLGSDDGLPERDFLHGERSWEQLRTSYEAYCDDVSFTDYFWTVRAIHRPLFRLAELERRVPSARVYHAISTGYAGFLGFLLNERRGTPLILSEHGIYTKERKIDLAQAEWIRDAYDVFGPLQAEGVGHLRQMWIRFFEGLGRLTYASADPVVSLYEGNRTRQIADGALPGRTRVIPNGVAVERFRQLRALRPERPPPIIGLLGRVVPIKDIRTFIHTMRRVVDRLPDAQGWIIGPDDEDEEYALECKGLVAGLGLEASVRFLGFRKPDEILPQLGLLMLTSISEALPLVLLEGFASGLPAIATDVGSCRELIEGGDPSDRALGAAGRVVPISDPVATADAAVALLGDEVAWRSAQEAAIARVERRYDEREMFRSYRALYGEAIERGAT